MLWASYFSSTMLIEWIWIGAINEFDKDHQKQIPFIILNKGSFNIHGHFLIQNHNNNKLLDSENRVIKMLFTLSKLFILHYGVLVWLLNW